MSLKNVTLICLALPFLALTACDKDDDMHGDSEITIRILSPDANEVVADASLVTISVEVEASDENHGVEIILHPDDDLSDQIIDFDLHDHDELIKFEQVVDLSSYPSGTLFHLEVEACKDHDCEDKEYADIEFSIP